MKIELEEFTKPCECGETHNLHVKQIIIERGAIRKINDFLKKERLSNYPVIVCDSNTYKAAGEELYNLIGDNIKDKIILTANNLQADEYGVEEVLRDLNPEAAVLIAVGAGTIHDITRYVAKERNIPFISVPTAASVDGFVSTVAAMTMRGFKVTYPAVSPIGVFADTDIFTKAPYRLTASGIGDLLGKYTAILDWQVASALTGEYICNKVIEMEKQAVEKVVQCIDEIYIGNKNASENLMYGLILSGLAMQMVGNSRPASGAEHHMSHLWEMHIINPEIDALHGEKVGVALGYVCDVYKDFLNTCHIHNIDQYIALYKGLPYNELERNFKHLYPSIIKENTPDLLKNIKSEVFIDKLNYIKTLICDLPSGDEIRGILKRAQAKTTLKEIGLDDYILEKSITLSPFVRNRLTLIRLLRLLK